MTGRSYLLLNVVIRDCFNEDEFQRFCSDYADYISNSYIFFLRTRDITSSVTCAIGSLSIPSAISTDIYLENVDYDAALGKKSDVRISYSFAEAVKIFLLNKNCQSIVVTPDGLTYTHDRLEWTNFIYGSMPPTIVNLWINNFIDSAIDRGSDYKVIRSFFRAGYCYGFAKMLEATFPGGQVCMTYPFSHAVYVLNNRVYDIEGDYEGESDVFIPITETYFSKEYINSLAHNPLYENYPGAAEYDEAFTKFFLNGGISEEHYIKTKQYLSKTMKTNLF